jgi:hypothetical protein
MRQPHHDTRVSAPEKDLGKRIGDIANEFGVSAEAIVEKCLAEGIPPEKIQGPMSTVSAGLEATIREWLSGPGTAPNETDSPKK